MVHVPAAGRSELTQYIAQSMAICIDFDTKVGEPEMTVIPLHGAARSEIDALTIWRKRTQSNQRSPHSHIEIVHTFFTSFIRYNCTVRLHFGYTF